jgi:DNA-3-methyladenine glycosylase II
MTYCTLSREDLLRKNYKDALKNLLNLRGVGKWTTEYVMMKCLKDASAFPIADVGLHNALRLQLGLDRKPKINEIEKLALKWKGWEAYATFYLWRSLYE